MQPLFIISLPRSGSTLLNKLLASHSQIASHSEPWILLPIVNLTNRDNTISDYSWGMSSTGINDIKRTLESKGFQWDEILRNFANDIYSKLAEADEKENVKYFLDKTPRYHLIVDSIANIFPDAKFLILTRNPLACLSSGIETWGRGKLRLHGQFVDLLEGPKNLSHAIELLGSRKHIVRYENLVGDTECELESIFRFLGIAHEQVNTIFSNHSIGGSLGDPTGHKEYGKSISQQSLNKYKRTLGTWYRKRFASRYIASFDERTLEVLGYDKCSLMNDVSVLPSSLDNLGADVLNDLLGNIWRQFNLGHFRDRYKSTRKGERLYIHS